jgi:3-deoxy-D-manno-octulosonic acid kinase
MIKGGQRIATATGVMLADPHGLGNAQQSAGAPLLDAGESLLDAGESLFDQKYWSARGELEQVSGGRGSAWFVGPTAHPLVLRHYRRGGFIARLSQDRYWWMGEDRVRAFAEWRLLEYLAQRGLPVPKPVAAWYQRIGPTYRCDLITQRIADTQSLSAALAHGPLPETTWRAVGAAIARLHKHGVDHADLNAHNILLDSKAVVSVIDFDRGRLRRPGAWTSRNLRRLQRSLAKISVNLPRGRFTPAAWNQVLAGYQAEDQAN